MLSKIPFLLMIWASSFHVFSTEKPKVVFLLAEREYLTESTLPKFAKDHLSEKYDSFFCSAPKEGAQRHLLSNAFFIPKADLLVISVRRRAFPEKTMQMIRAFVESGKPVLGIRTSSHAFELRKEQATEGHAEWPKWDTEVIGGNYQGHLGKGLICNIEKTSESSNHPILEKVDLPFDTPATLYRNSPLPSASEALLEGRVKGFRKEPVAWTRLTSFGGKVFYTSLGHLEDFKKPAFNQLLKNAVSWCLSSKVQVQRR